ncbi:MAG TPA: TetR/AcrR family transcriptional regulator C-terminal domain-containing protein [Propionicimonas sp.]|jgi:AcrR family transcriptional regulator|uniref:TetR/AcrR family transcriptional regulator C-terminal domain-containing protein n=1 Tax=Propionicimonas sp. TaxID=1955623 RepID=UPI002F4262B5
MTKGITRARIVETALQLLDEEGINAVTARALADRLGVRAPALYWHVGSKQEILDEMATEIHRRVARQLEAELQCDSWHEGFAIYARVLRREYLKHRDGARTFSGARVTDVDVLRAQETFLRRWTSSGLSLADIGAAGQLVRSFVVGFAIEEQDRGQAGGQGYSIAARDDVLGAEIPLVAGTGKLVLSPPDERFERYVEIILTGLEATLSR